MSVAMSGRASTYFVLKMLRPLFSIAPELKSPTATILYWSRSSCRPKRFSSHAMARFRHSIAPPAFVELAGLDVHVEVLALVLVLQHFEIRGNQREEVRRLRERVVELRPA